MTNGTTQIQKTTDYGQFKVLTGNRSIYKGHLTRLINSIRENNLLAANPIIVNESMEVIDGQHRLKAAQTLKTEIYYLVLKSGKLSDVQLLNSNNRNWLTQEYLESYCKRGFKDYKFLKDFAEDHDLSITNAMHLLSGGFLNRNGHTKFMDDFRHGDFVITHKDYAMNIAGELEKLNKYLEENVKNDRDFLIGLEKAYRTIKPQTLLDSLAESGWKIERHVRSKDYLRRIEDVINYKKSKNVTRLF